MYDYLIVGAGLFGSIFAYEANKIGKKVLVIENRNHIGGNCYSEKYEDYHIHKYGPHIFHTNNQRAFNWLSRFTTWIEYKHKVKIYYGGQFLTLPPNKKTCNILKEDLFEVVYSRYSKKMWGTDIDKSVLNRVKVRTDLNEDYFPDDKYQVLPEFGYTRMFENIFSHENIKVELGVTFSKEMEIGYKVFSSMPIDQYYDYCYGELPYRSIKFHEKTDFDSFVLPVPVVNFTDLEKYTRITNWGLFPNSGNGNYYTLEEPCCFKENNNERYYPIKDAEGKNRKLCEKYRSLSDRVTFIGRLGHYLYLNMDQVVSSTLAQVLTFLFLEKKNNGYSSK